MFQRVAIPQKDKVLRLIKSHIDNWNKTSVVETDLEEEFNHFIPKTPKQNKRQKNVSWRKPPWGTLKLNFDGSSLTNNDSTVGAIIRDWEGQLVSVCHKKLGKQRPLTAEALALKVGIQHARQLNIDKIQIEGDSKIIIDHLNRKTKCPWEIEMILSDVQILLSTMKEVSFFHVPRMGNRVADKVAHLCHSVRGVDIKNDSGLLDLIRKDAAG